MPSVFVASSEARRRKGRRGWAIAWALAAWLVAAVAVSASRSDAPGWREAVVPVLGLGLAAAGAGVLALPAILARKGVLSPARWLILALFFVVVAGLLYVVGEGAERSITPPERRRAEIAGEPTAAVPFHVGLAFSALMVPSCILAAAVHKVRA